MSSKTKFVHHPKFDHNTYAPDVLMQGMAGNNWIRRTGSTWGNHKMQAVFRPAGWTKQYQWRVELENLSSGPNETSQLKISCEMLDHNRTIQHRILSHTKVSVEKKICPMCGHSIAMDPKSKRWECRNEIRDGVECSFNYTADTCKMMYANLNQLKPLGNPDALDNLGDEEGIKFTHLPI